MLPTLISEDDKRPRFEYYSANSPTLRTVSVDQTPFTIGRGEENNLQISSTGVSRVHAELKRAAGGYLLRDLGSTNGTSVNGRAVSESILQDGDAVRIAEVELTFVCSSLGRLQRMATQPLAIQQPANREGQDRGPSTVQRSLNEALLWLTIPIRRAVIADLQFGAPVASIASIDAMLASTLQAAQACRPCSASERLQDLAWLVAVEESDLAAECGVTLLRLEQSSRLSADAVIAFQQAQAASSERLGVHLPWEWVTGVANGLAICTKLKSVGAVLSLEGFSGGAQCVEELDACPPDYVVLAPEVVRDVTSQRRRWQRLEITQASCEAAGIRTVLPSGIAAADETTCHALGIGLGVGSHRPANKSSLPAVAARS
ncbi:MAG: FHA domain-containing protein [Planctomycetales bacterium]|nr:FHA domain-containing protein [Planctomycetales bacterium]